MEQSPVKHYIYKTSGTNSKSFSHLFHILHHTRKDVPIYPETSCTALKYAPRVHQSVDRSFIYSLDFPFPSHFNPCCSVNLSHVSISLLFLPLVPYSKQRIDGGPVRKRRGSRHQRQTILHRPSLEGVLFLSIRRVKGLLALASTVGFVVFRAFCAELLLEDSTRVEAQRLIFVKACWVEAIGWRGVVLAFRRLDFHVAGECFRLLLLRFWLAC